MGYPKRIRKPFLTYSVHSACINREGYLFDTQAKDLFLDVIRMAQRRYEFKLHTYQIMDDHFHLMIRTINGKDSISSIMQFIKSVFARKLNCKLGRSGPLWNRRFQDTIIENVQDAVIFTIWLLWTIAYNPVRKGIHSSAGIFNKYSSIGHYTGRRADLRIDISPPEAFLLLGDSEQERIDQFLLFRHIFMSRISGPEYCPFYPAQTIL